LAAELAARIPAGSVEKIYGKRESDE